MVPRQGRPALVSPSQRVCRRRFSTCGNHPQPSSSRCGPAEGELALDSTEIKLRAGVLTNIDGIEALAAWRRYNGSAVIE